MKCLYKEPAKRYVSALDLALDLRRWQQHEPILARPTGPLERGLQWCQRNRSAAVWMTVAVLCLLAGSAVSTYYAIANHYLAELAGRKQREAEGNFKVASLRERESNWHDYAAQLQLMGRAWEDGNFGHLEQLMEQAESREGIRTFRGWEWSYLRDQCRQASRELNGTATYSGKAAWCRKTGRIAAATNAAAFELANALSAASGSSRRNARSPAPRTSSGTSSYNRGTWTRRSDGRVGTGDGSVSVMNPQSRCSPLRYVGASPTQNAMSARVTLQPAVP
jgi:hypothetical protein